MTMHARQARRKEWYFEVAIHGCTQNQKMQGSGTNYVSILSLSACLTPYSTSKLVSRSSDHLPARAQINSGRSAILVNSLHLDLLPCWSLDFCMATVHHSLPAAFQFLFLLPAASFSILQLMPFDSNGGT